MRFRIRALTFSVVLTACGPGSEMLVLAPLLPIGVAIDAVGTAGSIKQPIEVVDAAGRKLAGPASSETKPIQTIQTSLSDITCRGAGGRSLDGGETIALDVRCTNDLRGNAKISRGLTVGSVLKVSVGPSEKQTIVCEGEFYRSSAQAGPFLAECVNIEREWMDFNRTRMQEIEVDRRIAAAVLQKSSTGQYSVTIWLSPK